MATAIKLSAIVLLIYLGFEVAQATRVTPRPASTPDQVSGHGGIGNCACMYTHPPFPLPGWRLLCLSPARPGPDHPPDDPYH